MSVLYLYALIGDPPRSPWAGASTGSGWRPFPAPGFLVVVGRLDAQPGPPTDTALRRHDATMRRIGATVEALLPMRFGTVVPDEDAAARLLRPRAIELAGRLVHVRAAPDDPAPLRPRRGRRARRAPRAAAAPAWAPARAPATSPSATRLTRPPTCPSWRRSGKRSTGLVADERVQRHATPPLLASVYHLVPREASARYREPSGEPLGAWLLDA